MTDQSTIPDRRSADVGPRYGANEFLIEDFVAAMLYTTRDNRRTVELLVLPYLFDGEWWAARERALAEATDAENADEPAITEPLDEVSIYLYVTYVRQVWPEVEPDEELWPHYPFPEFELEGYLLDPPGQTGKFWVRLALHTSDDRRLTEATIYLLEPGEELGTARTPSMDG
jgi:hypothetical protein